MAGMRKNEINCIFFFKISNTDIFAYKYLLSDSKKNLEKYLKPVILRVVQEPLFIINVHVIYFGPHNYYYYYNTVEIRMKLSVVYY